MDSITYESQGIMHRWLIPAETYQRYEGNSVVEDRPFTQDDRDWVALVEAASATSGSVPFLDKIKTALTTDDTYLDKIQAGTVTNADHIAQIAPLTRQIQGLIVHGVLGIE
jgi:hypothetical protein